jgi:sulfur carrier protein
MITVNGDPLEWHGGMTVQDVLDARKFTFRMIGVWVNDEPVPKGDFANFVVPDGARVEAVHMVSGG